MPSKKIMINLTEDIVKGVDESVARGRYVSRSEVVREALRKFLESW